MRSSRTALLIACLAAVVAIWLLVDRGGLIAWGILGVSLALLAKALLKPSRADLGLTIGLAVVSASAWFGTVYYVISTYESGEVVELAIESSNGTRAVRLWVLDIGGGPVVYYDAEPELAESLLAGKPLRFSRGGQVSTRIPDATLADEMPEDQATLIYETMTAKYGDRMGAVDVYYLMLGRPRDRVAVVARLGEE